MDKSKTFARNYERAFGAQNPDAATEETIETKVEDIETKEQGAEATTEEATETKEATEAEEQAAEVAEAVAEGDEEALDEIKYKELKEVAKDLDIKGRSKMGKEELIEAIAEAEGEEG